MPTIKKSALVEFKPQDMFNIVDDVSWLVGNAGRKPVVVRRGNSG